VILLRLFGTALSLVGLAGIFAGTVLSAPYAPQRSEPGRGWWTMLSAGAAITLVGAPLTLVAKTPGGLLAVLGCVLVAIAVALGFPLSEPEQPSGEGESRRRDS
jgi:hypothetical protein